MNVYFLRIWWQEKVFQPYGITQVSSSFGRKMWSECHVLQVMTWTIIIFRVPIEFSQQLVEEFWTILPQKAASGQPCLGQMALSSHERSDDTFNPLAVTLGFFILTEHYPLCLSWLLTSGESSHNTIYTIYSIYKQSIKQWTNEIYTQVFFCMAWFTTAKSKYVRSSAPHVNSCFTDWIAGWIDNFLF